VSQTKRDIKGRLEGISRSPGKTRQWKNKEEEGEYSLTQRQEGGTIKLNGVDKNKKKNSQKKRRETPGPGPSGAANSQEP